MGSGLILLVIVGMWLAVLVPMALRSHDSASSLSSVDRFSDAMRVLSRRVPGRDPARTVLLPGAPVAGPVDGDALHASDPGSDRAPAAEPGPFTQPDPGRPSPGADRSTAPAARAGVSRSLAARRRRTLLVLLAVAALTLPLGVVGPHALLAVHGLVDLLAVAFVVSCRRQVAAASRAPLRAGAPERDGGTRSRGAYGASVPRVDELPAAAAPTPGLTPAVSAALTTALEAAARRTAALRVAGVPDRIPPRPAPLELLEPVPAARYEDAAPAAAVGGPWSPTPVPLPAYVNAPVAPRRPARVLDLTQPGSWAQAAGRGTADGDAALDGREDDELDEILHRRCAANDW